MLSNPLFFISITVAYLMIQPKKKVIKNDFHVYH